MFTNRTNSRVTLDLSIYDYEHLVENPRCIYIWAGILYINKRYCDNDIVYNEEWYSFSDDVNMSVSNNQLYH